MIGISRTVEEIIRKRPFLQEALSKDIINYASLSDLIKEDVEREIGKKVELPAIIMALRRLSDKLNTNFIDKIKFDTDTDVVIQTDLFEITLSKSLSIFKTLKNLYDRINFDKGDFLTITQGLHQITIISNKRFKKNFSNLLNSEKTIKEINNLASLTIRIPENAIDTVGLFFMITRALAWENVSIVEIVSTFTELTFILRENDITHSYDCIKKLINSN